MFITPYTQNYQNKADVSSDEFRSRIHSLSFSYLEKLAVLVGQLRVHVQVGVCPCEISADFQSCFF